MLGTSPLLAQRRPRSNPGFEAGHGQSTTLLYKEPNYCDPDKKIFFEFLKFLKWNPIELDELILPVNFF